LESAIRSALGQGGVYIVPQNRNKMLLGCMELAERQQQFIYVKGYLVFPVALQGPWKQFSAIFRSKYKWSIPELVSKIQS
jgi:hypothetical protein